MSPYRNLQLYMYFKASIIKVHQTLVLCPSFVPEKVGVNQKRRYCKIERNRWDLA